MRRYSYTSSGSIMRIRGGPELTERILATVRGVRSNPRLSRSKCGLTVRSIRQFLIWLTTLFLSH